jgi:hypothetical protein
VWQDTWALVRPDPPPPQHVARWAAAQVLAQVVKATEAAGPEAMATAARDRFDAGGLERSLAGWLAGSELPPIETYLARAALWPLLVALQDVAATACADDPGARGGRRCPRCGGTPQVSVRALAEDRLVSGARQLVCARCAHAWSYSASACPSCGENAGAKHTVYAEHREGPVVGHDDETGADPPLFPHIRIDACATCHQYLLDVDLSRDAKAVPEVDELAALPLALYAADQGLSKITPNLMGF